MGSNIEEYNQSDFLLNIDIYPNPFSSSLAINFKLKTDKPVSLSIFSLSGTLIYNQNILNPGLNKEQIIWTPENSLPKGMYLVVLQQNNHTYFKKVCFN